MATALSTALPRVLPFLIKCPSQVAQQALEWATAEFFRRSGAWIEDLAAVSSVADQDEYTLATGHTGVRIHQVRGVTVDDVDVDYTFDRRDYTLTLDAAPTESSLDIVPTVVYFPPHGIDEIPDELFSMYSEAIVCGALGHLKSQSGMGWYDPQGARFNMDLFDEHIADAISADIIDGGEGSLTMTVEHVL